MAIDDALMRDIVGWDIRTWSRAFRFWDDALGQPGRPLDCLEIGAGGGGPSLWLALKGNTVLCSNRQDTELMASPLHRRYGVSVAYEDIDATNIPYENHFDVIVFKSVLGGVGAAGGLPLQRDAMREIHKALKPGGRLLYAENLRGTVIHRFARAIAYRIRRSSWRFVSVAELRQLFGGFASYDLHTTGVLGVFGVTEQQRHALAGPDEAVLNRLTPTSWHYLGYGIATKGASSGEDGSTVVR